METINQITDEALLALYQAKSLDLTHYQCAEGETWYRERTAREKCKEGLALIVKEVHTRGLTIPRVDFYV